MIASLPMYDRPETAGANDRLWAGIRDRMRQAGLAAPDALRRGDEDLWRHWMAPDLALSQTCGFPYRARLHGRVTLIGTPDFGVAGCPPGYYRSVFVARATDPRPDLAAFDGATFAYNEALSQSGWAAPASHMQKVGLHFGPLRNTGGHLLSAGAVADGRADFAALDAVTWQNLRRWDSVAADLKVIAETVPTPGLPYISSSRNDPAQMFDIVTDALASLSPEDRDMTGIRGLIRIPAEAYLSVPTPPTPDQLAHLA